MIIHRDCGKTRTSQRIGTHCDFGATSSIPEYARKNDGIRSRVSSPFPLSIESLSGSFVEHPTSKPTYLSRAMSQQPAPKATSPTASTVSLISTTSNSSTATLLPKKPATQAASGTQAVRPAAQPKDFEASFASLSSSYGFVGAPVKPAKKDKKSKSKKGKSKATADIVATGGSVSAAPAADATSSGTR